MKFLSSLHVMAGFLLSSTLMAADAGSEGEAKKLLEGIHQGTRSHGLKLKDLPQNFGGHAPKLLLDRQKEYSDLALKLGLSDEAVFQEPMQEIFFPLENMFKANDFNLKYLSSKNAAFKMARLTEKGLQSGRFTKHAYGLVAKEQNEENASRALDSMWKGSKIDFAKIEPFSLSTPLSGRDAETSLPLEYKVIARIDVRSLQKNGNRAHDRLVGEFRIKKHEGRWIIQSLTLSEGERIIAKGPSFQEHNAFARNDLANHLRKEAIRRGGYALAVGDLNSDGNADMVVGHLGPLEIFMGDGKGSFKKVQNKDLGIDDVTLVKSAVIADFNNNGEKDLLLVRFAPSESDGSDIILYRNTGDKFKKETSIKNRYPAYYAMPSAVADFSGNGLLDFYIGFPGAKDFTVLNEDSEGYKEKKERHPQGLFYNSGDMKFVEVTKEKLPYTKEKNAYTDGYPESAVVFPHSSVGIDYDLNGSMDIVVIDDKANLSPLYRNKGKGSFEQVADKIGLTNHDFGMGFTAADLDNDGKLEFIYTNVNFLPAERLHHSLVNNFSDYSKQPGTFGVRVFKTNDGKKYSDVTALTGINGCGEGIGGVEVIDYDSDGNLDVYVANGLWSGPATKKYNDLSSLFVRAYSTYHYDFQEVLGTSSGIEEAHTSFMRILTGYQGDVESMKKEKGASPSMAGFQRNCLFRNNGNGTFTEVAFLEGVDSIADGYVVGTADLNKDGKMDLLLRNGDPGNDANRFPAVQVFLNQNKNANSVLLSLEGRRSNKDAVGTILKARIGNKVLTRHMIANNGAVQSQALIHFGLGNKKVIDELEVRWPSGATQLIKGLKKGNHHLVEPHEGRKTAGK